MHVSQASLPEKSLGLQALEQGVCLIDVAHPGWTQSVLFSFSPHLPDSLPHYQKKKKGNGRFLPTVKTFRFLQGQLLGIWLVFPRSPLLSKIGHHSLAPSVPGGKENHYIGEFLENSKQSSRGVDETVLFLKAPKFLQDLKTRGVGRTE